MYSKINNQNEFTTALTLSEAKAQLNILTSNTLDDGYIASLILACTDLAQTFTRKLMTEGNVSLRVDGGVPVIELPYGSPSVITELIIDDVDVTADVTKYNLDDITEKLTINVKYDKLKVSYDCGYSVLPAKVKQGILIMITNMFENRSEYVVGMSVETLSTTATDLLRSVKYYAT